MEERLTKQQFNNDLERDKLQMLIAKLEAHILQQSRQIEHVSAIMNLVLLICVLYIKLFRSDGRSSKQQEN